MKKSDLKRTGWILIGGVMILGGLVLLLAGQAKTAVLARSAADVAGGDNTTFLPVVSRFVAPSSIVMVP